MYTDDTLLPALEALLFVSGEPISIDRLAKTLDQPKKEIEASLGQLEEKYIKDEASGLMLIRDARSALLATKPPYGTLVENLTKSALQENLSKPALEVLAIVAYRAPVSRAEIDAIRGVNCSFTLRNLLLRDLISKEGNPSDNRGYLYRPTLRFLQTLGIGKITELPHFENLSQDERLRMILENDEQSTTDAESGAVSHQNKQK